MEQARMPELRQRLADIQEGLEVNLTQTKEYVPMSGLAEALSEVFSIMDNLAAAIEDLERRSGVSG